MTNFEVQILGCGSALPTLQHLPSSQLIKLNGELFMIDCGEGAQLQMRKMNVRMSRLNTIFISHLHGDHVFGLPGLVSTYNLLNRTNDLTIYAHQEIKPFLHPMLEIFCKDISYRVNLVLLKRKGYNLIFENKDIEVYSFPLKHRIAANGFLFKEKEKMRHIKKEMIEKYNIPVSKIKAIKQGEDFITTEGRTISNNILTTPPTPARAYAYCSDTQYYEKIVPYIQNIDVLYHEATFAEADEAKAKQTAHSTAQQAAQIAKLANVKKLVIGHFSSRYKNLELLLEEARSVFPSTELAYEGKVIKL